MKTLNSRLKWFIPSLANNLSTLKLIEIIKLLMLKEFEMSAATEQTIASLLSKNTLTIEHFEERKGDS